MLNSDRYVDGNRGPRFKVNTPEMSSNSILTAQFSVKPVDGTGGDAALYYNDDTTAQATNQLVLNKGAWNTVKIVLTDNGGTKTREIFVNDISVASDAGEAFPVFWGTGVAATGAKVYIDDLIITESLPEDTDSPVTATVSGGSIEVDLSQFSASKTVIVALYDDLDRLIGIRYDVSEDTVEFAYSNSAAYVKVMDWDVDGNNTPAQDAIEAPIE